MRTPNRTTIHVYITIHAQIAKVWSMWILPEHIIHWNHALKEWHTPLATNDLRVGGRFVYRMEAKDGSAGFDYSGIYTKVDRHKQIEYTIDDGRKVQVTFTTEGSRTIVQEIFEAEQMHSIEMQKSGWLAILDNFKRYVESKS